MPADRDIAYTFGRKDLGPAIAGYLSRLHAHILAFEQEHGARTLYVSRAGIRIRRALDTFVRATKLRAPATGEFFWISRLVVARGVWNRKPEASIDVLSKEYRHINLPEFVRGMFRFAPSGSRLNPVDPSLVGNGADLGRFLESGSKIAEVVQTLFRHQGLLFEGYIKQLLGSSGTALLVDTGWQATAQTLLAKAFPEYEWWGAYFGRSGFPGSDRSEWHRAFGLVFEADGFDPKRPETSANLNRHLIEYLFEPKGESIQWLAQEERGGQIIAPGAPGVLADAPTRDSDPMFVGVLDYLAALPEGVSLGELRAAETAAWQRIMRLLVHPTKDDLAIFAGVTRSADFGRDARVPLLPKPEPRFENDTPDRRIQDSLWPCGQAAVEYPNDIARALQKRMAGDLKAVATTVDAPVQVRTRSAVAVITRTMDRPLFLERALMSVAKQTFREYIHVVVNDGGDNDVVKATIEKTNCDQARVRLVDAVKNRGMEAASNLAIANADSDYVVIHDDDDTWEPTFLAKTVAFLDGKQGKLYGGAITKSSYVSEEVTPKGIVVHDRAPYNGWVENVHLMEMAIANFYPPIAFLFRREVYDKLGGFNEQYPVLGDWDFNLRFLVEADIALIPEALANYHHRDRGDTTTFGNSVIAGRSKHLEFASIVRNNLVRSLVGRGHAAAATLAGVGLFFEDQRNTLRAADNRMTQLGQRVAAATSSSAWTDHYWVAFQQLLKSVVENDAAALEKIRAMAVKSQVGLLARVGMGQAGPARAADLDRAAAALMKDQFAKDGASLDAVIAPPDFDEAYYLRQNPDVAAAVAGGRLASAYDHYIRYGRREGRNRPVKQ